MLLNIIKINLDYLEYLCDGLLAPASPDPLGAALLVHVDAHLLLITIDHHLIIIIIITIIIVIIMMF